MYETIQPDKYNMFLYKKKDDARIKHQNSNSAHIKVLWRARRPYKLRGPLSCELRDQHKC